jgi:BirA family biotin operon repressor/biotin-[acetyl-CoA-carboxylase] ligase
MKGGGTVLDKDIIKSYLHYDGDVIILEETDSTNNVAKSLSHRGIKEGTVIIAKRQTQGRGRMGRSFLSMSENGLYMTLFLKPELPPSECVSITVMCACAVCEAIESVSDRKCRIKWVNDIYIEDKKVCGILTEASADFIANKLDYAIVGVGVNVSDPKGGFDDEIKDIAGSVYEKNAPVGVKNRLCAEIINNFMSLYRNYTDKSYMENYRKRSNIIGKSVDVYRGDEIISGVCIDIDNEANLVVKTESGEIRFNSGDARVRRV